jgi:hypothetical protein
MPNSDYLQYQCDWPRTGTREAWLPIGQGLPRTGPWLRPRRVICLSPVQRVTSSSRDAFLLHQYEISRRHRHWSAPVGPGPIKWAQQRQTR